MRTPARLMLMLLVGAVAAVATGVGYRWSYAPLVGWAAAALSFELWAWLTVGRMDPSQTRAHAVEEDPSRYVSHVMLLGANLASLGAVAYVIFDSSRERGADRAWLGVLALAAVGISWSLVQTLYTLRYARLYYSEPVGGVDFNTDVPPTYHDFAYFAFNMGMTYQVADTNLTASAFRVVVLRHALLSYVFGSVILATTINLVVGLSSG